MESQKNFSEQLHQAQQGEDRESAIRVAHTLKGVAGNISARDIYSAADKLESACKNQTDQESIEVLLTAVENALKPVLESLNKMLQQAQQMAENSSNY